MSDNGTVLPFRLLERVTASPPTAAGTAYLVHVCFGDVSKVPSGTGRGALRGTNRGTELLDAKVEELVISLHLPALCEGERVLHVDAQIANGAFDLRVAEQDLHGAQVPRLLIDDGRLGSAQRMGPVIFRA
jgi:hypothetical protein